MEVNLDIVVERDFGPQPSGDSSASTRLLFLWQEWQRSTPATVSGKNLRLKQLHQWFELRHWIPWKETSFHWLQDSEDLWLRGRTGSQQRLSLQQPLQDFPQVMGQHPNILSSSQAVVYLPLFEEKGFLPPVSDAHRPFLNKHRIFVAPV